MKRAMLVGCGCCAVAILISIIGASTEAAAPTIERISLRGLKAGGTSKLLVQGSGLATQPRLVFFGLGATQKLLPNGTADRFEVEVTVDAATPAGIYLLRVATPEGISNASAIGVDAFPQMPWTTELRDLPAAMSGELTGNTVLQSTFAGEKGQRVVLDVEAHRLGSKLDPVVRLFDDRHVQLAWGRGNQAMLGDARCSAVLPRNGKYTIELNDEVFDGHEPGFFRLKVGDIQYADAVFPLGVQRGSDGASLQFVRTNLPQGTKATLHWPEAALGTSSLEPCSWPEGFPNVTGPRPAILVSDHVEIVESPQTDGKPQELPQLPVAVNGRLSAPGQRDRYRLPVTPGMALRFDVMAARVGSPVDGVLTIQNEQGGELAKSDDQPTTIDPGLEFTVPPGVNALVLELGDVRGAGGSDFVYRIEALPRATRDFALSILSDRIQVPSGGAALVHVRATRTEYEGPIKLAVHGLPAGVTTSLDEVPAGATDALVTLTSTGTEPTPGVATIAGQVADDKGLSARAALVPDFSFAQRSPWLRRELGVAVTLAGPIKVQGDFPSGEPRLTLGGKLPIKVKVDRAPNQTGTVRIALVTSQITPRKEVEKDNQKTMVDDVERMLRLEGAPMIAADQNEVTTNIIVPGDLRPIDYDLALQADLLAPDNKTVVASAFAPARRLKTASPITLELAGKPDVEARAGQGPTGKLTGHIRREGGNAQPVTVTLVGLPKGVAEPSIVVPADKSDFEFELKLPYGTPAGNLQGLRLLGAPRTSADAAARIVNSNEIPLNVTVVAGEKPPAEPPFAVFEDQADFIASLSQGEGQISLDAGTKYSGSASIKITPVSRFNPDMKSLRFKIRENPGPGEFRYLQFAWLKKGGQSICLQLNHDGEWGPSATNKAKFRYHSGPGQECYGASERVDEKLPEAFAVVTRDLFADFGEFTLTGLALVAVDGEYCLFDHMYLSRGKEDFELVKPK